MPNSFTLSSIGARGLVVFDGRQYKYVQESVWRSQGPSGGAPTQYDNLKELHAVVAHLGNTIYVNLDELPGLEASDGTKPGPKHEWEPDADIVLREQGALYQVSGNWQDLPVGFEGDAGVLVNRGAVVATIPSNSIPSGTYCILVNLAALTS
jgi:hypothetical protein